MSDTNIELTVEQKLSKVLIALRKIRPYYSAVYEVMEKHEKKGLGSIGVTTNALYYDPDFIDSITFDEILFIMLHEIAHISLGHVARRENRDPRLWNVACDLYVNSLLSDEFNLREPGESDTISGYSITFPSNGLFCSTVDLDNNFTEEIYAKLEEQKRNYDDSGNRGGYYVRYTGSKKLKNTYYTDSNVYKIFEKHKTFKLYIEDNEGSDDLIDEGQDQGVKNQESSKLISDAVVRTEMRSGTLGDKPDRLQRYSKELLKSELDWKRLLKKYLIAATSKDSSFRNPDKRMFYANAIYPGQTEEEENKIKGIKICVDVSGSIDETDLAYFYGQVYDLTKKYKVNAELIYWDTVVQSNGDFEAYKEFERICLYGGGGTNPKCIFNYFESKSCKVKPIVTLVFTDGYLPENWASNKIAKKYKDTIWILTREYNKEFKPPFGKKAIAKFK